MGEVLVEWRLGPKGLKGVDKRGPSAIRKIIFPQRGQEDRCCRKIGHLSRCSVVRDTRPEDPFSGAIIVRVLECVGCAQERAALTTLGEGWKIDEMSRLIAPDGVFTGYLNPEKVEKVSQEFAERQRRKALRELLTQEFVTEALALPLPEGEPAVLPVPERPLQVEDFFPVGRLEKILPPDQWARVKELLPPGGQNRWLQVASGKVGDRRSWEYSYLSPDERGERTETVYYLQEQVVPGLQESSVWQEAVALVQKLRSENEARRVAWVEAKEAWAEAQVRWTEWFCALPVAQKIRRLVVCQYGRTASLAQKKGEWVVVAAAADRGLRDPLKLPADLRVDGHFVYWGPKSGTILELPLLEALMARPSPRFEWTYWL